MTHRRILLVHENVQSARFTKRLLEEAGFAVDWRPSLTPALLRSCTLPDVVVFDMNSMDEDDQASLCSLQAHARWGKTPILVTAAVLHREARLRLSRIGVDDVMSRPADAQELLVRLKAIFRTLDEGKTDASIAVNPAGQRIAERPAGSLEVGVEFAKCAGGQSAMHNAEAILVQLLRSFRRKVPFDVGFVCAETEPDRYMVVAHLGDEAFETARWYEPGVSYTGWMALHKKPLLVPDMEKELRVRMLGRELGTNRNFQSFIGVPLMDGGHVVGTIEAACYRSGALGQRNLETLQDTGEVASLALRNVQARQELAQQVRQRFMLREKELENPLICESLPLRNLLRTASKVRESQVPVLITGETGTGKEVLARYLHGAASRYESPFVAVSCAAVPETFQSREMFGIESGVLSGVEGRAGRFEECAGGTLFLDEVGHMSISLQAKLLRVLEERRFSRIGSSRVQRFDGRVIATTTADLKAGIAAGTFLPELYYRLALIELEMPPLRSRLEDVVPLFHHFAAAFCHQHLLPLPTLEPEAIARMLAYHWPGNVRELKNAVERSILLSSGEKFSFAGEEALAQTISEGGDDDLMSRALRERWSAPELEQRYSQFVYAQVGRNKAQACRILRINYRTLRNHLNAELNSAPASQSLAS